MSIHHQLGAKGSGGHRWSQVWLDWTNSLRTVGKAWDNGLAKGLAWANGFLTNLESNEWDLGSWLPPSSAYQLSGVTKFQIHLKKTGHDWKPDSNVKPICCCLFKCNSGQDEIYSNVNGGLQKKLIDKKEFWKVWLTTLINLILEMFPLIGSQQCRSLIDWMIDGMPVDA